MADTIAQHLTGCANCRREYTAYQSVTTALNALKSPMTTHDSHTNADDSEAKRFTELNEAHESIVENIDSSIDSTPLPQYRVSEDFNVRLLDRIAQERYAEIRSEAHMPKAAPRFMPSQLVPVLGVAALAVFTTLTVLDQSNEQQFAEVDDARVLSEVSQKTSAPSFATAPALSVQPERPLGADLGLSDEYMTAQPINNPVLAGERNSSSQLPANSFGPQFGSEGLAYTDAGGSPYSTNNQWHFARELQRAQRFIEISNMLGSGHTHFEIISFNVQRPGMNHSQRSYVIQFGRPMANPAQNRPQIILQPNNNSAVGPQNPAGRMVGGSF